jgi:hypothetical protein
MQEEAIACLCLVDHEANKSTEDPQKLISDPSDAILGRTNSNMHTCQEEAITYPCLVDHEANKSIERFRLRL